MSKRTRSFCDCIFHARGVLARTWLSIGVYVISETRNIERASHADRFESNARATCPFERISLESLSIVRACVRFRTSSEKFLLASRRRRTRRGRKFQEPGPAESPAGPFAIRFEILVRRDSDRGWNRVSVMQIDWLWKKQEMDKC